MDTGTLLRDATFQSYFEFSSEQVSTQKRKNLLPMGSTFNRIMNDKPVVSEE